MKSNGHFYSIWFSNYEQYKKKKIVFFKCVTGTSQFYESQFYELGCINIFLFMLNKKYFLIYVEYISINLLLKEKVNSSKRMKNVNHLFEIFLKIIN